MLVAIIVFAYMVVGSGVTTYAASKWHQGEIFGDSPAAFFAGVLWPALIPLYLGSTISNALQNKLNGASETKRLPKAVVVAQGEEE